MKPIDLGITSKVTRAQTFNSLQIDGAKLVIGELSFRARNYIHAGDDAAVLDPM